MEITTDFIMQVLLAAGIGTISFFMRGVYGELKQLSKDVRQLSNAAAAHEAHRIALEQRISRLEIKTDKMKVA
jgi:hypothetical protein